MLCASWMIVMPGESRGMSVPLCMTNTFEMPSPRESFWFDLISWALGPPIMCQPSS